ncbi:MAG TPA: histidine kinase [Naasia sp.]|jgi:signal transduction histidine kinase
MPGTFDRIQPRGGRRARATAADILLALVLAALALPVTVMTTVASGGAPFWAPVTIAAFGALHLLAAVVRYSPTAALAGGAALMLGLTALSFPGFPTTAVLMPSSAAFLVLVFAAAGSDSRWLGWSALVVGLAGAAFIVAVVVARAEVTDLAGLLAMAGFLVASIGAAWAGGRYRRELLRKRSAEDVARTQAAELRLRRDRELIAEDRRRIGRDVHDVVSHSLAVMVAQAEAARVLLGSDDAGARAAVEHVVATGRSALADMRGLVTAFADDPAGRGIDGGPAASHRAPQSPSPRLADLHALVASASGPQRTVRLVIEGSAWPVSPGLETAVYRIAQESLTNTLKHTAPPTLSRVLLRWSPTELTVTIDDDGGPIPEKDPPAPLRGGRGVDGMRHRVLQHDGMLQAGPQPGTPRGWSVVARLPRPAVPSTDSILPAGADRAGADA